eukprot:TRINITY_DN5982_c0_g1_i10.p1 TRINITY_DN5982_c0_g1~~TRINITY_DN5982_c0_g1_i10.p1  ORF type:complete len:209 (+),score=29.63 TRINITY_DN5982_c0_g1_i10:218-844(+)
MASIRRKDILVLTFFCLNFVVLVSSRVHQCEKKGAFDKPYKVDCVDDEYYCCGIDEDKCCTWDEYYKEHEIDGDSDIIKIVVGVVVGCIVFVILLLACCCCLPCCLFAKRKKARRGQDHGPHQQVPLVVGNNQPVYPTQQAAASGSSGQGGSGAPHHATGTQGGASLYPTVPAGDRPPPYSASGETQQPSTDHYPTKQQPPYNPNAIP